MRNFIRWMADLCLDLEIISGAIGFEVIDIVLGSILWGFLILLFLIFIW
jgi:hypothetical protein